MGAAAAHAKPFYDWVANDGRVIQAEFVRLDGETVIIDEKWLTIPRGLGEAVVTRSRSHARRSQDPGRPGRPRPQRWFSRSFQVENSSWAT